MTDEEKAAKYDDLWDLYKKKQAQLGEALQANEELCKEAEASLAEVERVFRMTLRDEIARDAMRGLLAGRKHTIGSEDLAKWAYRIADAMLEERE